jgi:2-polyprenylphenol hydroxylase and related flavodoxin oxidoreductases
LGNSEKAGQAVDPKLKHVYYFVMQPISQMLSVLDLVPFGQTAHGPRFYALRLSHPQWAEWHPGQFLMLRPQSFGLEIPWGRPLCICHLTTRHLICFFEVKGRGTERMANLSPGDNVEAWGPLGNWFDMETEKPTLIVAGGMGIAPFVGYVNRHPKPWNMTMLFGHRQPLGCYPVDSINEHIPVDSLREDKEGDLDNFIFSIQERMRDCAEQEGLTLACGPEPFLRTVQKFALEFGSRCQLSLEKRMACGVGACLGCVTKTRDGRLLQTCWHGSIFDADKIII